MTSKSVNQRKRQSYKDPAYFFLLSDEEKRILRPCYVKVEDSSSEESNTEEEDNEEQVSEESNTEESNSEEEDSDYDEKENGHFSETSGDDEHSNSQSPQHVNHRNKRARTDNSGVYKKVSNLMNEQKAVIREIRKQRSKIERKREKENHELNMKRFEIVERRIRARYLTECVDEFNQSSKQLSQEEESRTRL